MKTSWIHSSVCLSRKKARQETSAEITKSKTIWVGDGDIQKDYRKMQGFGIVTNVVFYLAQQDSELDFKSAVLARTKVRFENFTHNAQLVSTYHVLTEESCSYTS